MRNSPSRITAQVACESIANSADDAFETDTIEAVLEVARSEGVSSLYINMVEEVLDRQVSREERG